MTRRGCMLNIKDPRIIRTKTLLHEALLELVQQTPIQEIKISQLTAHATISRATFYQYYRNIQEVMEEVIQLNLQHVIKVLNQMALKPNVAMIEQLLKKMEKQATLYFYLLTEQLTFRTQFMELIIERLELVRENSFAIELGIKKDVLIWRDASAFVGMIEAWLLADCCYSASFLAKQFSLLHHLEKQSI